MSILSNIIKHYRNVTDFALDAIAKAKNYNFKKMLVNDSSLKIVVKDFSNKGKSKEAKKLIKEYNKKINQMYLYAKIDYSKTLKKVKAAKKSKDNILLQKILNDFANNGITGFVAKNGAKWNIETYSNMLTVHINNSLIRLAETERIKNKGKKLVKISDHNTKCELCIPYENKLLTFKELDQAISNGLYHPNCKHYHMEV